MPVAFVAFSHLPFLPAVCLFIPEIVNGVYYGNTPFGFGFCQQSGKKIMNLRNKGCPSKHNNIRRKKIII